MDSPATRGLALPKHFYSLDALRGVAALSVVLWHWQHFYYGGGPGERSFKQARQPLYAFSRPLYAEGYRAVDLFFCLSGFIFFWLYADSIRGRGTTLRQFASLRISRLYPLHLATLLFVAVAQALMLRFHGGYFVYQYNDFRHFVLHLFFASNWGIAPGYSFNYPVWSVSVEVFCYAVFFILSARGLYRWWHLSLFIIAGMLLKETPLTADLGRGVLSFFAGGLTFWLFVRLARRTTDRVPWWLAGFTVVLWVTIPSMVRHGAPYQLYRDLVWRDDDVGNGNDPVGLMIAAGTDVLFELVLFPITILALALWETRRGTLGQRFAALGQISYSTYLLHFPLQMVFAGSALWLAVPKTVFDSPWMLALFFAVLVPISLVSYRYFERPCQSWLRSRLHATSPAKMKPGNFATDGLAASHRGTLLAG